MGTGHLGVLIAFWVRAQLSAAELDAKSSRLRSHLVLVLRERGAVLRDRPFHFH